MLGLIQNRTPISIRYKDLVITCCHVFCRTVASTVVVIQRHKLIQTVSDRVVKVSCYLDQSLRPSSPYNNLTLNASFYVANPV